MVCLPKYVVVLTFSVVSISQALSAQYPVVFPDGAVIEYEVPFGASVADLIDKIPIRNGCRPTPMYRTGSINLY